MFHISNVVASIPIAASWANGVKWLMSEPSSLYFEKSRPRRNRVKTTMWQQRWKHQNQNIYFYKNYASMPNNYQTTQIANYLSDEEVTVLYPRCYWHERWPSPVQMVLMPFGVSVEPLYKWKFPSSSLSSWQTAKPVGDNWTKIRKSWWQSMLT